MDRLTQLQRMYLVHSFLYYHLNESIVSDQKYDAICEELRNTQGEGPYDELCSGLGQSGSGFYIKKLDYPSEIVTTALRLLWDSQGKPGPFDVFVGMHGYALEKERS